jgi:shikimate kinase
MARVLMTGMSGSGKTTVLDELRRRGHLAIDTDYDGWVLPDGTWDESRMARLLADHRDLVVSGTVSNQGRFYDRFEHVVLLSAPLDVLIERVQRRSNNPYGKSPGQQAEIRRYVDEVEPLLRRGAGVELDGRLPVGVLADRLEELLAANRSVQKGLDGPAVT